MIPSTGSPQPGLAELSQLLEVRLGGRVNGQAGAGKLEAAIPRGSTYVVILFDGLGIAQLAHPAATELAAAQQMVLHAPFPTTTSVSLATFATGLPPGSHGIVGHLCWWPEADTVVNTLKWIDLAGRPVIADYPSLLAEPNLWERLKSNGAEPITVQPGAFENSPLTQTLYRGCRFEGVWDTDDLAKATVDLARQPGRLIFVYVPHVDFAGHVFGLDSSEFDDSLSVASDIWERISSQLPDGAVLLGTADHGLIEYSETDKVLIRDQKYDDLRFAGDPRGLQVWGSTDLIAQLAHTTGSRSFTPEELFPGITDRYRPRLGDRLLLAPEGRLLLPRGFDKRLRSYHGGLHRDEVEIPLMVG